MAPRLGYVEDNLKRCACTHAGMLVDQAWTYREKRCPSVPHRVQLVNWGPLRGGWGRQNPKGTTLTYFRQVTWIIWGNHEANAGTCHTGHTFGSCGAPVCYMTRGILLAQLAPLPVTCPEIQIFPRSSWQSGHLGWCRIFSCTSNLLWS